MLARRSVAQSNHSFGGKTLRVATDFSCRFTYTRALKTAFSQPLRAIISHSSNPGISRPVHPASMSTAASRSDALASDLKPSDSASLGSIVPQISAKEPTYDITLEGRYATIVPIATTHADDLFHLLQGAETASLFDYLFDEPYDSVESLRDAIGKKRATTNPWTYTILLNSASEEPKAVGMASLMRMDLPHRVIEVGSILYTPALQRTPAATEAMYLLARYAFETLGFRRYEWKCNSLNTPSCRAAVRLGFTYEGTFKQHMIIKGRSRDTAWYAMVDKEWPKMKSALEKWLDPGNFDGEGKQKNRLQELRV